jgi:S1-C subfamily serine protease
MVYNSWNAMKAAGEKDANTCAYNDLALLKLDPADVANANPSIPFWGGPTGVRTSGLALGDTVLSYGNSSLRAGVTTLSPKQGKSVGDAGGGWSHDVYTVTPGIPGDSGSAFVDASGKALGILSTVAIAPLAGSNGVGDVAKEIAWMQAHGGPNANIVNGTEAFTGPLLPI